VELAHAHNALLETTVRPKIHPQFCAMPGISHLFQLYILSARFSVWIYAHFQFIPINTDHTVPALACLLRPGALLVPIVLVVLP
jgi:hypothetical protein